MKFKQWLQIGIGKRDLRFDEFYDFAMSDGMYPWKKSFDKQVVHMMIHCAEKEYLEILRDAYFEYLTVWL